MFLLCFAAFVELNTFYYRKFAGITLVLVYVFILLCPVVFGPAVKQKQEIKHNSLPKLCEMVFSLFTCV